MQASASSSLISITPISPCSSSVVGRPNRHISRQAAVSGMPSSHARAICGGFLTSCSYCGNYVCRLWR